MKYILLDTNMIIYREGEKKLGEKLIKLNKILLDSNNYKIVIHPYSIQEINKLEDNEKKETCLSKLSLYTKIVDPPVRTIEFLNVIGKENSRNDYIDNCILYAIKKECAHYLITNDKGMLKKAKRIEGLKDCVLSIDDAVDKFKLDCPKEVITQPFINKMPLHSLNINDSFFDSLKADYLGFETWFSEKSKSGKQAYIVKSESNDLQAFLMLKIEECNERYDDFDKPFVPKRRVKISTMKVLETGKRIGEAFIKIIVEYALKNDIDEIYVTVFPKYYYLIRLLEEYGFEQYSYKNTISANNIESKENVYLKKIGAANGTYPTINFLGQQSFIVPIKQKYHEKLFTDSEKLYQPSFEELFQGIPCANSIKKAYLTNTTLRILKAKDILFFYASEVKKSITTVGVVDQVYSKSDFENFENFKYKVLNRTVYYENDLKDYYTHGFTLIMFKYYFSFEHNVTYKELINIGALNGFPQRIQRLPIKSVPLILKLANVDSKLICNIKSEDK